jgi:hypothetical protein
MGDLEQMFQSGDTRRDNFLSRLFGLFSEEVVRKWAANEKAPYEYLGRPHLRGDGEAYGHTLDFTLCDRSTGRVYVAEMKCELAFEGYRYLRLTTAQQLDHHEGAAFTKFRQVARDPAALPVTVGGKSVEVHGAILVWGAATPEGRTAVIDEVGVHDVVTVEDALRDLRDWNDPAWQQHIEQLAGWSRELFGWLADGRLPPADRGR